MAKIDLPDIDLPALRHRPPFVFHDRIVSLDAEAAAGIFHSGAESVHYCDGRSVDGVDLIESLAQVAGIQNRYYFPDLGQGYLVSVDDLELGASVPRPADLRLSVRLVESRGQYFEYHGDAEDAATGATVASGRFVTYRANPVPESAGRTESCDGWRLLHAGHVAEDRQRAETLREWDIKSDGAVVHRRYDPTETFFLGHFPDEPIVPGIIHVKEMVRACGHFLGSARLRDGVVDGGRIEKVRFNKPAGPGDLVEYKCTVIEGAESNVKFRCMAISDRRKLSTLNINVLKTN
ncbi:hypothetical protein [Fodinicurvata sp. EGI_FJ10296]|uniref:hypothetical protein n=1 Tax=Fodinicurvata sp. EGI_FJ10296 TaxID=3231908 RepID=UPI0034528706